jgi:hypothetical protein
VAGCHTTACSKQFTEQDWKQRHAQLIKWKAKHPKSITAQLAYAGYFLERGWSIRGTGYSHSVKKEAWDQFYEHLALSRAHLMKIYEQAKIDPAWYEYMLMIGLAQHWPKEQFETIYNEGIKNHPTYLPMYFTAAAYHSPKWYGSLPELKKYIEGATKHTQPFWGSMLYARLNWSEWSVDMFKNSQVAWPQMKQGFEQILGKHPDAWNINHYAKFSCFAPDPDTLFRLLAQIGNKPIITAWGTETYFYQCIEYAKKDQAIKKARMAHK